MTQIDLATFITTIGDPGQIPHSTWAVFTPWRGNAAAERYAGSSLVLPDGARFELLDGIPVEPIIIEPDDGSFCWRATVVSDDPQFKVTRYVSVPDVPVVSWESLIDVDRFSFLPTRETVNSWASAVRSPTHSVLTIEVMTESEFAAHTPAPTQLTHIIPG